MRVLVDFDKQIKKILLDRRVTSPQKNGARARNIEKINEIYTDNRLVKI